MARGRGQQWVVKVLVKPMADGGWRTGGRRWADGGWRTGDDGRVYCNGQYSTFVLVWEGFGGESKVIDNNTSEYVLGWIRQFQFTLWVGV